VLRRLALAGVAAVVLTGLAWRTGNWWTDTGAADIDRNLTVARVVLCASLFALFFWGVPALRRVTRPAWLVFAAWTAYLGLWALGQWPGELMTDSVDSVVNARQGVVRDWYSWVHGVLHLGVLDVVPHVAALLVLQLLALAGVMAYASALVLRRGGRLWVVAAMNLLAALSAPVVLNALLVSRDTPYALGHVTLALLVADAVAVRKELTRGRFALIVLLTGVLTAYRGDGLALILVVPLLLALRRPPVRVLAGGAAAFASAFLLFNVVAPAALDVKTERHHYELILRLNPLGQLLQDERISAADRASLARVVDVDAVVAKSTPLETPVFWDGDWKPAASEADWTAFFDTSDRLLRDNLPAVVGARFETLEGASGLRDGGFRGTPPDSAVRRYDWIADRTAMTGEPPVLRLYTAQTDLLQAADRVDWLQWNFLPSLVLLLLVLPFFRSAPFEAAFAVVLLSRVPLLFAAAPAAQFKYYLAVHLGGIVLAGLLLARLRLARATAPAVARSTELPA